MMLVRLAARPMLASVFFVGGLDAVRNPDERTDAAEPLIDKFAPFVRKYVPQLPEDPKSLVRITGVAQMGAALLLATGRMPRLSAAVLATSMAPAIATGHRFWQQDDPQAWTAERTQFFKNCSMLGGLLLAAVDTEGKPGVAWRARRAATDVRREARGIAKSARREAKLAKAQLT